MPVPSLSQAVAAKIRAGSPAPDVQVALRKILADCATLIAPDRACAMCGQLWTWWAPAPLPCANPAPGCCGFCGDRIPSKEHNQRYCNAACRQKAWKAQQEARQANPGTWKHEQPAWKGSDAALCRVCVRRLMAWAKLGEMPPERPERVAYLVWVGSSLVSKCTRALSSEK